MRLRNFALVSAIFVLSSCDSSRSTGTDSGVPMNSSLGARGIRWKALHSPWGGTEATLGFDDTDIRFDQSYVALVFADSTLDLRPFAGLSVDFESMDTIASSTACILSDRPLYLGVLFDTITTRISCVKADVHRGSNHLEIPLEGRVPPGTGYLFHVGDPCWNSPFCPSTHTSGDGADSTDSTDTSQALRHMRFTLRP